MIQTLVSVIIPCYNGESVINYSIESVYMQDYAKVELIVVDDGSTDGSKEIILSWEQRFIEKGYLLKYVYQDNRGLGGAIDTGLKYVTGKYLTLLDSDDYYLAGSIFKRAMFLDKNPDYAAVRSNGWMDFGNKKELFISSEDEKKLTDIFSALIFGKTNNWAGTYMVRTDILFDFYPERNIFPSRFGQNMQIILPVAYKRKFGYIDEPLMVYVLHSNSLSKACSFEEQFQKDEYNAQGYRDIYVYMINSIVRDQQEHQKYMNAFQASFYRCAMLRAIKYDKRDLVEQNYEQLCLTKLITLDDRIAYYDVKKSLKAVFLRGIRKCKGFLKRIHMR